MKFVTKHSGGYTLIEMVITAALVGILSIGIVSVFMSTVQGSKTARAQAEVKSQGDYAITTMERTLRNAIKLPICLGKTIEFQYLDENKQLTTMVYEFTGEGSLLAKKNNEDANSMIQNGQTAYSMLIENGTFTCTEGNSFSPGTVTISYTLTTQGDERQTTSQQFQTTVVMRNIP